MQQFTLQLQPFDNVCGQAVCAMVTGASVRDVVQAMRKKKTQARDLKQYLSENGWGMTLSRLRLPQVPSGPAIVSCHFIRKHTYHGHWVLWTGSVFLDPAAGELATISEDVEGRFYDLTQVG